VKIGDVLSDWLQLAAGMPQGSYLGPLTFVILIDALRPGCLTQKYVDDTTMTEVLDKSAVSNMQSFVDELVQQATEAGMIVNGRKTKEILIGSVLCRDQPLSVTLSGAPVERVTTFRLLGVHVANNLKWAQHDRAISSKAASRLHFLKRLKRSGAGLDLRHSCTAGARVCVSGVAFEPHGSTVEAAERSLDTFKRQLKTYFYEILTTKSSKRILDCFALLGWSFVGAYRLTVAPKQNSRASPM